MSISLTTPEYCRLPLHSTFPLCCYTADSTFYLIRRSPQLDITFIHSLCTLSFTSNMTTVICFKVLPAVAECFKKYKYRYQNQINIFVILTLTTVQLLQCKVFLPKKHLAASFSHCQCFPLSLSVYLQNIN